MLRFVVVTKVLELQLHHALSIRSGLVRRSNVKAGDRLEKIHT